MFSDHSEEIPGSSGLSLLSLSLVSWIVDPLNSAGRVLASIRHDGPTEKVTMWGLLGPREEAKS